MSSFRDMFRKLGETMRPSLIPTVPLAVCERYGDLPVVVLISGYYYGRPLMRPMANRFKRAGYQVDYMTDALYEKCSFEEQQRRLVDAVRTRMPVKEDQQPDLIIIGHAVGGLHAYRLATTLLKHNFYRKHITVIALGAPFQRKQPRFFQDQYLRAGIALRGAASLLLPREPIYYSPHTRLKSYTIAARHDEVVPRRITMLPDRWSHYVLDTNHAGLIFRKDVFKKVLELTEQRLL